VWQDVCSFLSDPERVRRDFESRLRGRRKKSGRPTEQLTRLIASVRRGIARLIDAYQEGYLERDEFEPRIHAAKERLAKLESESKIITDREAEEQELQKVIGHLQSFAARIKNGLEKADWNTRREILRALVRKVEIGESAIRIEYKVGPLPFDHGPKGANSQHCGKGDHPALRRTLRWPSHLCLTVLVGLDNGAFQPHADQLQHRAVGNPSLQTLEQ
jgi:site-specific DNA recombinase